MSTTNNQYTSVQNTVVSASSLLGSVSGSELQTVLLQSSLARLDPIVLTQADPDHDLTGVEYEQAAVTSLSVNATAATGSVNLYVGEDSVENALSYVNLFELNSTSKKALITFKTSQGGMATGADPCVLNLRVGTAAAGQENVVSNVLLALENSAATGNVPMLTSATAGTEVRVEVYLSDATAGDEKVTFNVL